MIPVLANLEADGGTNRELPVARDDGARTVSLVFPIFNEGPNFDALRRRVNAVAADLPRYGFQIVLVDDHSTDESRAKVRDWFRTDPRVVSIRLSRNFGSHAALAAGLDAADGDCAIFMSADLQDPPELIPQLLEKWEAGSMIVWAARESQTGIRWTARLASAFFWWIMRIGAREATPVAPADFALLDRRVIDAYQRITCRNESLIATLCWLGFEQSCVPYPKSPRDRGRSGWTFGKRLKLCVDSIVGFSYWPIRAMSVFGVGCAAGGFVLLVYTVWHRLLGYTTVPGWAGLMSAMLTGMGILMVMVGVLGEYLWRVLDETRGRPKYIVEEVSRRDGAFESEHPDHGRRGIHRQSSRRKVVGAEFRPSPRQLLDRQTRKPSSAASP